MAEVIKHVGKRGKVRYTVRFTEAGRRHQKAIKGAKDDAEAERYATAIQKRIDDGLTGVIRLTDEQKAQATITIDDLVEKFCTSYTRPKLKDADDYRAFSRTLLKRAVDLLKGRAAASITQNDVEDVRDQLSSDLADGSVRNTMARLGTVYRWGKAKKWIACDSPVAGVEKPTCEDKIDYFTRDEIDRLLAYAHQHGDRGVYQWIYFCLATGVRKGESFAVTWNAIDLDGGKVRISRSYAGRTKTGKSRSIDLTPEIVTILRAWQPLCPHTDAGLTFPVLDRRANRWGMGTRNDTLGFVELLRGAGCHVPERQPIHSLRHSCASHAVMAGVSLLTLKEQLGHASLKQTEKYAHLSRDHKAAEMARLSFAAPVPAKVTNINRARATG